MSMQDQIVYVAGGCGIVGSGIVKGILNSGAICWVSTRDKARFDELLTIIPSEHHSRLFHFNGDVSNEAVCIKLREDILQKHGKINHVISSIGTWWMEGTLSEVSVETYEEIVKGLTFTHFVVYKTFAKLLSEQPNSTYTFICGGSSEARYFEPKASLIPIGSSMVAGIYTAAASEFKDHKNLAVIQLKLFLWIRKQPDTDFNSETSDFECGHDYIGKFVPKIISKHKSEIYRIQNRTSGDKLFAELNAE